VFAAVDIGCLSFIIEMLVTNRAPKYIVGIESPSPPPRQVRRATPFDGALPPLQAPVRILVVCSSSSCVVVFEFANLLAFLCVCGTSIVCVISLPTVAFPVSPTPDTALQHPLGHRPQQLLRACEQRLRSGNNGN
jgi:hypothetical protein